MRDEVFGVIFFQKIIPKIDGRSVLIFFKKSKRHQISFSGRLTSPGKWQQ